MRWTDLLVAKQPNHCAISLCLTALACSSVQPEIRLYEKGVLCHVDVSDGSSDSRELRVVFDECASYCAEIVEATCEVSRNGADFQVEARATTSRPMDGEPCPSLCKRVEANCNILVPSDSDAAIEFAGEQFTTREIRSQACSSDLTTR
jgi:hypothetical protein